MEHQTIENPTGRKADNYPNPDPIKQDSETVSQANCSKTHNTIQGTVITDGEKNKDEEFSKIDYNKSQIYLQIYFPYIFIIIRRSESSVQKPDKFC